MGCPHLRRKLSWEIRKDWLHNYGALVFAVCGILHAPETRMGYVVGSVLAIYLLDSMWVKFMMTYQIENPHFRRLDNGVVVTFKHPLGAAFKPSGFIFVNIPFVSESEWHPFSVYKSESGEEGEGCVHIQKAGDWTTKLFKELEFASFRPVWLRG